MTHISALDTPSSSTSDPQCDGVSRGEDVAAMMAGVLGLQWVGLDQSFHSLGGHSLGLMTLRRQLETRFNISLRYGDLFRLDTPRQVARLIDAAPRRVTEAVVPGKEPVRDELPATEAQKRLYFATLAHADSTAYNVPVALKVDARFSPAQVRRSLLDTCSRHAGLRATFHVENDEIVQRIRDGIRLPFTVRSLH